MSRADSVEVSEASAAWEQRSLARVGGEELERSRRIIRAARELVEEGGLEAVALRPVLDRSGLSRRAFYERFGGMDDVLLALFEETMARGAEGLAKRIAGIRGAPAKVEAIVRTMASSGRRRTRNRGYVLAMSSEHARLAEQRPAELREATRPMNRLIARILEDGMEDGTIRKGDPEGLAEMLHALVASEVRRNLHLARPSKRWVDDLCEFCLHGIGAR